MKTKRDLLDYLDFGIKTVGGLAITILTVFLGQANTLKETENKLKQQEIDNSMKYGEYTKSLIRDLLRDSSVLKSDLTFITLNRSIGDQNPKLIVDLGIRIIQDFYEGSEPKDKSKTNTIINIVKERDTIASKLVDTLIANYNLSVAKSITGTYNSTITETTSKDTLTAKKIPSIGQHITEVSWAKLTVVPSKATVFIQVNKDTLNWANKLQKGLNNEGFNAPGIETITKFSFRDFIRYYHDSDAGVADQLSAYVKKTLKRDIKPQKVDTKNVHNGTIELWINQK